MDGPPGTFGDICMNCQHWKASIVDRKVALGLIETNSQSTHTANTVVSPMPRECRALPPSAVGTASGSFATRWPETHWNEYCGAFKWDENWRSSRTVTP